MADDRIVYIVYDNNEPKETIVLVTLDRDEADKKVSAGNTHRFRLSKLVHDFDEIRKHALAKLDPLERFVLTHDDAPSVRDIIRRAEEVFKGTWPKEERTPAGPWTSGRRDPAQWPSPKAPF